MTKSTISRIENGLVDRVLFDDVVNLDTALQANGKVLSIYWVAIMRQMGVWYSMKDRQRQPLMSKQVTNLADTFVKVTRWSYLYDDHQLPWIEPWIAPAEEVSDLSLFNAYLRGDRSDYEKLAQEIYELIPGKFFVLEEADYKGHITPDLELGIQVWDEITKAVGDDPFGLRMMSLLRKNFQEADYIAGFRVLLRELLTTNRNFLEIMTKIMNPEEGKAPS